ncbi:STN domain-containing protein [Phytopseudomonas dryadis]|uniref:Secretin/TonB short N-terminal domain-containing protein n=1 Tax=Phytopseudomonas dryadis TaxID=2487520 RepID=A0A4Q9QYM7_9GAMM|nr:STN domain-containing protein [Pseudomonas dryadis]TBU88441.1 hypothetical protein DNK44_18255 [Pseudomonas dryadis]
MNAVGSRRCSYRGTQRTHLKTAALAAAMFCVPQALGYAQTAPEATALKSFNIPAQPLAGALREFARQSQQELLFTPDVVAGKSTAGVQGAYSPGQALEILLRGTGVTAAGTPNGATLLRPDDQPGPATPAGQATASPDPAEFDGDETALAEGLAPDGVERRTLDTVAVTGTRIKGGTTASPTITVGSERIQEEGFSDLGEVIRSIPQNFTGGQNPGLASGRTAVGCRFCSTWCARLARRSSSMATCMFDALASICSARFDRETWLTMTAALMSNTQVTAATRNRVTFRPR